MKMFKNSFIQIGLEEEKESKSCNFSNKIGAEMKQQTITATSWKYI